jgi:hypothetical protein
MAGRWLPDDQSKTQALPTGRSAAEMPERRSNRWCPGSHGELQTEAGTELIVLAITIFENKSLSTL